MLAESTQAPQHVRDVTAEHAAQRVQLVDDDVAQAQQERGPPVVRGEDAHVQHLGVGEHDVGVRADPRALVGGGVAVVGRGDEVGHQPLAEAAELILRERLGGEHQQRRVAAAGDDRVDDRQLVAERLARRGAGGDDDVAIGAERLDRGGLVRPQRVDAAGPQPFGHRRGELGGRARGAGGARGDRRVGDDAVEVLVREVVEGVTGVGPPAGRGARDGTQRLLNGSATPRRRRSRRAGRRRHRT